MHRPAPIHSRKPSEEGYTLLAVMFMLFLFVIWLSVAAPEIGKSIQRDRDLETMHRGEQYVRAIQLYYRKFGAYPPSVKALVKTDNIRFLRKQYIDPITGKDDWKPIPYDPLHPPVALGFFGQPLAGAAGGAPIAGTGPSGGNTTPGAGLTGPTGGGSSSTFGGGMSTPGSLFGSSGGSSGPGATPAAPGTSPVAGGTSAGGSTSTGGTSTGSVGTTSGSSFMSGQTGQTFGGAGIVGVSPASSKQSILIYKKKDHYNQWQFTYNPLSDMQKQAGGNPGIGQPASQMNGTGTTGGTSTPSGFGGSSFGNPGTSGPGGGFGSSPSPSPTQPAQPQQ